MNGNYSNGETLEAKVDILDEIDALIGPRPSMGSIALRAADKDDFGTHVEGYVETDDFEADLATSA